MGMTAVVRLETTVDIAVREDSTFHHVDGEQQVGPVSSSRARPAQWPGPLLIGDPRQVSASVSVSAVLDDGRRIVLLDDRGWGTTGHWDATTIAEIEDTARAVAGPDEPIEGQTYEEAAAAHWAHLATLLGRQGVISDAGALRSVSHVVVLSDRLRARVES